MTNTTYRFDPIDVDLSEEHIAALAAAYPPPRYYADPEQMRSSIHWGIMFNIIDTSRGEKADLVPLTMEQRYRFAFAHRIRQTIKSMDIPFIDAQAQTLGTDVLQLWQAIKAAVQQQVS